MSVDVRINVMEDKENKNVNIGVFIDRKEETEIELSVARKLYNDIMSVLDKTLPPSDPKDEKEEESKIIVP